MDCTEAQERLEREQDGELDTRSRRALQEHLAGCEECSAVRDDLRGLRSAVRDRASYFAAPDSLRQRISSDRKRDRAPASRGLVLPWWGFATSLATAALLAVAVTLAVGLPAREDQIAQQVVASHIRSLMENHLADVASTDQHTVKPWFSGKLDFSPPVHDLATEGFALLGGRLDYIGGRPVAALVYQRRRHRINVFVWPVTTRPHAPSTTIAVDGYNGVEWTQAGMTFWAVSDLNLSELGELKRLLEHEGAPG
jgi:anti-sigma factor RsiW